MLVLVSSNVDLDIFIVSPKHVLPPLFIFAKEMLKREIVRDLIGIVSVKYKLHA